jgi:hypothetical protein
MDILYDQHLKSNDTLLQVDSPVFGLGVYCDGATFKRKPMYNVMGSGGVNIMHAVLEIKDCSEHKS